jgi:hypothetical protein
MKPMKRRAVIADLPPGISVHKLGNGYFRVRLGKKFTGGTPDRKDFKTVEGDGGCRKWIEDQVRDRGAIREMKLTPEQLVQAKEAFLKLGDIPLGVVVDYYFKSGPGDHEVVRLKDALALYKEHHAKAGSDPDYETNGNE